MRRREGDREGKPVVCTRWKGTEGDTGRKGGRGDVEGKTEREKVNRGMARWSKRWRRGRRESAVYARGKGRSREIVARGERAESAFHEARREAGEAREREGGRERNAAARFWMGEGVRGGWSRGRGMAK